MKKRVTELAVAVLAAWTADAASGPPPWETVDISGDVSRHAIVASGANTTLYDGVAAGVGFTSITVAWLSQLNAFAMIAISMMLAVISKGAETLQTRLAVPASISDIITGILLFCMLGCEFFINYQVKSGAKHK